MRGEREKSDNQIKEWIESLMQILISWENVVYDVCPSIVDSSLVKVCLRYVSLSVCVYNFF